MCCRLTETLIRKRQWLASCPLLSVGNSKSTTNTLSCRHSGPTTGTGIVIVAISTCGPGRSAMGVLSQTARLVSKTISAAALIFGGTGPGVRYKRHLCGQAPHFWNLWNTWRGKSKTRKCVAEAISHLWKGRTLFAFQCLGLFYSDWLSAFRIFLPIHYQLDVANCSINWLKILANTMTLTTGQ